MSCTLTGTGCHSGVVLFPHSGMPGVLKQAGKQLIPKQKAQYSFCAYKYSILSHVVLCTNREQAAQTRFLMGYQGTKGILQ